MTDKNRGTADATRVPVEDAAPSAAGVQRGTSTATPRNDSTVTQAAKRVHDCWVAQQSDVAAIDGQGSPEPEETELDRAMELLGTALYTNRGRESPQRIAEQFQNVSTEVKHDDERSEAGAVGGGVVSELRSGGGEGSDAAPPVRTAERGAGSGPVAATTGPRGRAGEVTIVDLSGDGTGPWRLMLGEWGVADWPSRAATEDPKDYVEEVARVVRLALDSKHGPLRPERAKPAESLNTSATEEATRMAIRLARFEAFSEAVDALSPLRRRGLENEGNDLGWNAALDRARDAIVELRSATRMSKATPVWYEDPKFLKGELERIAGHPECPKAIYNIAADALCWARKIERLQTPFTKPKSVAEIRLAIDEACRVLDGHGETCAIDAMTSDDDLDDGECTCGAKEVRDRLRRASTLVLHVAQRLEGPTPVDTYTLQEQADDAYLHGEDLRNACDDCRWTNGEHSDRCSKVTR